MGERIALLPLIGEGVIFQARARQRRGGVTQSLALPTSNSKGKALLSKRCAFQRVLSSSEHSLREVTGPGW